MAGPPLVAVTFPVRPDDRSALADVLGGESRLAFLADLGDKARAEALKEAKALLSWMWESEIRPDETGLLGGVRFLQLVSAGVDGLPFLQIPSGIRIAGNVGAYAGPMAEHALAMVLALAKRLPQRHAELARGEFRHFAFSRTLAGAVAGILGYGGIGRAVARLLRPLGARIHAVNTSGRTEDDVEFVGTLDDLEAILRASDILVVALPLTARTRGLIGRPELELMRSEAILVNVARGDIVDQAALFDHLRSHPDFMTGLDVWWREPLSGGEFRTDFPFFELPNVLGTPHNSALVPGSLEVAARRAAENVRRYLRGEPVEGLMKREDYAEG
jgi:phosphoglycerate dehydrogenase-like enzyme